jgi:enterochelin esterase-like enzyme
VLRAARRRFPEVARRLLRRGLGARLLALAWVLVGLVGLYSYLENYWVTRGFAAVKRHRGVRPGRLLWVRFYSPALERAADYLVYLPTGYDPARRYPVFYLLHGMPGRPQAYIRIASLDARLDNLIRAGRVPPMIAVFPDGRINGRTLSDSEWANTSSGRYEDYVLDVVRDVDARFSALDDRDARVIAGYSAGATGALNITLHHLPAFASFEAWSGPFVESRSGVFAHATSAQIAYYSPLDYARHLGSQLVRYPLQGFLYGGRADFDSRQLPRMAAELRADGAAIAWRFYPGGHDWQLWNAHLDQMLILAGRYVLTPPPPPRPRTIAKRRTGHLRRRAAQGRRGRHAATAATIAPMGDLLAPGRTFTLTVGLLLALWSAAAINVGFLLQQRGLRRDGAGATGARQLARAALGSRSWLAGQAVGWLGFAAQIAAVAIAPLALVQAFAAGGLALSVPLAAGLFGHRVSRRQAAAVLLTAAGLASLPLALGARRDHLQPGTLIAWSAVATVVAIALARLRSPALRAIAAGVFYGVADGAIKAVAVGWHAHGADALLSGWTLTALVGTFAGFLAFQAALRAGEAVAAISLMNALATLVALGCGMLAFAESIGRSPLVAGAHTLAVLLVLACLPALAAAQTEMAGGFRDQRCGFRDQRRRDGGGRRVTAPSPRVRTRRQAAAGSEQQRLHPRAGAR